MRDARFETFAVALALVGCVTAFGWQASSRAWVNDDAFITFRYAAHVADGHGIVWNVVEPQRVEGSTSLGWTLLNAAAIRAGFDPLSFSHALGLLAGALTLVVLYFGGRRALGLGRLASLAAPALLCLQRQWVVWSTSGMEMTAATLLLTLGTLRLIGEQRQSVSRGSDSPEPDRRSRAGWRVGWGSGLLFAMATLLRPESPLLHAGCGLGLVAAQRSAWRGVATSGLVHASVLVALTLWRLAYFGQPLPNTFYVKVGALQLERGMEFLARFVVDAAAWPQLAVIVVAALWTWRRARVPTAALATQIVVWCAWVAALGGGRWEFRLLVPILPALALWTAVSLAQLGAAGGRGTLTAPDPMGARAVPAHPRLGTRARPLAAVGLAFVLVVAQVQSLQRPFRNFGDVVSADELLRSAEYMALEAGLLARYVGPQDRICTGWAGAIPYITDAWHFDPWGLNDPTIARRPHDPGGVLFHQRHASWSDVIANRVTFCDLFNHFLFPQPFDPRQRRNVVPWVEPGVFVYSARLPEGHHWIFASALQRAEVESRLRDLGLELVSVFELPGGWPRLGE